MTKFMSLRCNECRGMNVKITVEELSHHSTTGEGRKKKLTLQSPWKCFEKIFKK